MAAANSTTHVEYRQIAGADHYRVGNDGTVWSNYSGEWKQLKGRPITGGYLGVVLYINGKRTACLIQRLVLEAFVGPCPEGMEACHGPDHDPKNNRLENLRWDTHINNMNDSVRAGRIIGERHARARLSESDIAEIRRRVLAGEGQKHLAEEFGVARGYISTIVTGRCWTHISMGVDDPAARREILNRNRSRNSLKARGKLTEDGVAEIRRLVAAGTSTVAVAKQFGVSQSSVFWHVRDMKPGRRKKQTATS